MIENEVSIGGCTARKRYGGLFREENLFSQREWLHLQKIAKRVATFAENRLKRWYNTTF